MRVVTVACVVLLAASSCKEKQGDTKAVGTTEPAESERTEPRSIDAAAQVAEPGKQSVVFFAYGPDYFAPLGCFDFDNKQVVGGDDCLRLVPLPAELRTQSGATVAAEKVREDPCEADGSQARVLTHPPLDNTDDEEGADFAIWPADAHVQLTTAPRPVGEGKTVGLDAAEAELLARAVKAWAPKARRRLIVDQVVPLDIDGDGVGDHIYSGYIEVTDADPEYPWSGLVLVRGADPNTPVELARSAMERFAILGTIDLDGDKQLELWYHVSYYEGAYLHFGRVVDNHLVGLGAHGCGA